MNNEIYIRRILVSPNLSVSLRKQKRDYQNIRWDIVFQRGDGWTLAAPSALESEAYEMYKEAWVGFARFEDRVFLPIALYRSSFDTVGQSLLRIRQGEIAAGSDVNEESQ